MRSLTGLAMVFMDLFGVRLGFSFSAGLFDYVLNFSHAQRPLLLLPVGAGVLGALLRRVSLLHRALRSRDARPGARTECRCGASRDGSGGEPRRVRSSPRSAARRTSPRSRPARRGFGSWSSTGRRVDEPALKRLGARGIVRPSATGLQVVLGPIADQVAGRDPRGAARGAPSPARVSMQAALLAALGGRGNVIDLATAPAVCCYGSAAPRAIDEARWRALACAAWHGRGGAACTCSSRARSRTRPPRSGR